MFAASDDYPSAFFGFLPVFSAGTPVAPAVAPVLSVALAAPDGMRAYTTPTGDYPTIEFEFRRQ